MAWLRFLGNAAPTLQEPWLVSLLKGGTAQGYSVIFSGTEVAFSATLCRYRGPQVSLGLLQKEDPEAHQLRRQIWLKGHMNGAGVASSWVRSGAARGSMQRKS